MNASPPLQTLLGHRPELLTVKEVAKLLRVGPNRVYSLVQSSTLPSIRFGKRYLIPHPLLLAWIAQEAGVRKGTHD